MKVIIDVGKEVKGIESFKITYGYIYNGIIVIHKDFCQPLDDNIRLTNKEEAEKIAVELEKNRLANLGIYNVLEMIKYYRKAIKELEK